MSSVFFRYIRCFFALILIFSLGMILVSLIPNDALEPQYTKSLAQLDNEEIYPIFLFSADGAILDNFTDRLMIETCHVSSAYDSSVQAAFGNNGYSRYWNGYLLTLRPFLTQFTYQQIRYINMFLLLVSFCFCFSGIQQQLNAAAAFGFAVSMIACFLVFIGESLQYFSVFMIFFMELLLILYVPYFRKGHNSVLLLFAGGMVTNFFDMLTAPLLTLGIPLIVLLCLNHSMEKQLNFKKQMITILTHALLWCLGYGLCWTAKWVIGSLVLGENIFEDAMKTAHFRVNGNEAYPLDRALMFKLNFETYFFAKGHKPAIFLLIAIFILAYRVIRHHDHNWLAIILPVLIVGLFPYAWYFVFANHSQLHYFYTYRSQAITLFAIFAALGCAADQNINK